MSSEVCSHVRVVVRVRPVNDNEKGEGFRKVVQVVDNHILIFDPKEQVVSSFGAQRPQRHRNVNQRANKDVTFVFDSVFGEDSTQTDLFENTTKGVLDGVLNGFNCTVFAYGATGAGKTHTMLGSQDDPGVMYHTMTELFSRMEQVKEEKVFDIAFSYLEVYNEQIRDLLANVGPLAVREDGNKGVVVQGLTLHQPKSAEHILQALDHGNRNRTQHPTDMNATSSRSHAVFQIYLKQQAKTASLNPNVHVAKMSLIDLAGAECASATNAKGARLREGANINRSLLALGNVINALANPLRKKTHIPYRDSKLTRLLKDSLGGNCRTVMIANVSPSSKSYDDTHNTLKYANRAKEIKSTLKSNVVSLDSHISQYAVVCEQQRQEILKLKKKLKEYEDKKVDVVHGASNAVCTQKQAEFHKVSESLQSIFCSRGQIRRDQLGLERQLKENELRQHYNEDGNLQVQFFCNKDKTEKATCKYERKKASLLTQHKHIHKRLGETEQRFLENDGWLHRVENEMKLLGHEAQPPEVLQKDLQCHRLGLQVNDLKQQIEHMMQLIVLQDQENKRAQKMVSVLLPAYSRHHDSLRSAGLITPADETENRELEHLVLRERGVVWADQELVRDGSGEEAPPEVPDEGRTVGPGQKLAPFLSFSHLLYHQNSPCSAEARGRRVSLRLQTKGAGEQGTATQKAPTKNPIRRNLSASLSSQGPVATSSVETRVPTASHEDMVPLQYTPERTLPLHPSAANDPNTTFEFLDTGDLSPANATIMLQTDISSQALESSQFSVPSQPPPRANQRPGPTARPEIPSLLDLRRAMPPYMAMTSAAQGKRKFNCVQVEATQVQAAPKRMRVRRMGCSEENEPRRVVRSVSEGNLSLLKPQKSKSIFYKTSQQFKRVTKRL